MDKQQLKEEVGKLNLVVTEFEADGMCYMDRAVNVTQVYDLIDQLDEPEKVETLVVPKYVDDWITKYRDDFDLYRALKELEDNTLGWELTYKWYRTNTHKFVNAYLTGEYEVEEEQKYYVDLETAAYVAKWSGDNQVGIYTDGIFGNDEFEFHLTEQEIKNYDERFWPFAVEVEE